MQVALLCAYIASLYPITAVPSHDMESVAWAPHHARTAWHVTSSYTWLESSVVCHIFLHIAKQHVSKCCSLQVSARQMQSLLTMSSKEQMLPLTLSKQMLVQAM